MMYLIKDKHGFTHEILDVEPDTLDKYQVDDALKTYMRRHEIDNIVDFTILGFQKYLYEKYGVRTKSVRPHTLNIQV